MDGTRSNRSNCLDIDVRSIRASSPRAVQATRGSEIDSQREAHAL